MGGGGGGGLFVVFKTKVSSWDSPQDNIMFSPSNNKFRYNLYSIRLILFYVYCNVY